jgi:hypothetical protein
LTITCCLIVATASLLLSRRAISIISIIIDHRCSRARARIIVISHHQSHQS